MSIKNLIICGAGIKSLSHHTKEFDVSVKSADIVIYLVNEPLLEIWLTKNTKKSFSLNPIYFSYPQRDQSYKKITETVISSFNDFDNVCLVFYGHPILLADSVNSIIKEAKTLDINVQVLPGISAFDCLLADLEINLNGGCFLSEASHLIKNQIKLDTSNHVIIWQVGVIDVESPRTNEYKGNVWKLKHELLKYYHKDSEVYLYEASIYPHIKPLIKKTKVGLIDKMEISSITTAYIPPLEQ
jgi:tetrapyrrole methylase family protein/MazG family protein